MKVFAKHAAKIDVSVYQKKLDEIRDHLRNNQHAVTYETPIETPKTVLLLRKYLFASLYDRMAMRPMLTTTEKLWIAYQLLVAVRDIHKEGLCHGDIKVENVLVTSWNWAMLSDFSPFKPSHLPEASFFFFTQVNGFCSIYPLPST